MIKNIVLSLFVAILIAGCGGGGKKSSVPVPATPPVMPGGGEPPQQPPVAPAPEPRAVREIMNGLIDASTVVIKSNTINADIWSTRITQPTPTNLDLSDMTRRGGALQRLETRHEVPLAGTHSRGVTGNAFDYGGWMDHSFFLLAVWNPMDNDPLDPSEQVFADVFSVGNATGTNPISGSATWRGAVVGVDASETDDKGNVIIGDAMVGISNFSNPSASVSFTNLVDQTTNERRASMSWSNMPVRNGAFDHNGDLSVGVAFADRGDGFNSLTGRFYGPNHEEVGGVFIRDEVAGAFGARR